MADQVQFRGGTAAENDAFTGANKEISVDTTNKQLRVHDGAKAGGFPQLGERQLKNVDTYTELKALTADAHEQVYVRGRGATADSGQGVFVWISGDQSALVTADPGEWEIVSPDSDATGASGVWQRQTFETITDDRSIGIPSDYATLQAAVDAQSKWPVGDGARVIITIATGHALTAGLSLEYGDYRHFVIRSIDAEVPLSAGFSDTDVIKCFDAHGPELDCLIDADGKGGAAGAGVWLERNSAMNINNGAGVKNSGGRGLYVNNSRAYAGGAVFDGSASRALWATRGAVVHAELFKADSAATGAGGADNIVLVYASRGSSVAINQATLTNSGATEAVVFATRARIVAELTDMSNNNALYTARARSTGVLSIRGATVNTARRVARADEASLVNAEQVTYSGLTQSSTAFTVAGGGTVLVDNTNTEVTIANTDSSHFNKVTAKGVVYHLNKGPAETHVIAKNNQVVNNSSTRTNDTELLVALDANSVYMFEARLFFQQDQGADPPNGWQWDFTVPAGTSGNRIGGTDGVFRAGGTIAASTAGSVTGVGASTSTVTSPHAVTVTGYLETGGTAGNLRLRWAQNSAHASDSTRLKGSSIRLWRA